jgi:hypothetical protein
MLKIWYICVFPVVVLAQSAEAATDFFVDFSEHLFPQKSLLLNNREGNIFFTRLQVEALLILESFSYPYSGVTFDRFVFLHPKYRLIVAFVGKYSHGKPNRFHFTQAGELSRLFITFCGTNIIGILRRKGFLLHLRRGIRFSHFVQSRTKGES